MFLATTALEEFWDTRSRVLFLGDWCLLRSRRAAWEPLDRRVLPYPLDDAGRFEAAAAYCDALYERLLPALGERLGRAHGVSFSPRYWRILLGPWLLHYVQVLYDRHLCLRAALDLDTDPWTIGLSPESYFTPRDFAEMQSVFHSDAYNLQLFTQLAELLGLRIAERRPCPVGPAASARPSLKAALARWRASLDPARRGKVWLCHSLLGPRLSARLALQTRGAALPAKFLLHLPRAAAPAALDGATRGTLADLALRGTDAFSTVLLKTLPANLPWSFLEGYARSRELIRPYLSRPPKALVLDTSLYAGASLSLSAELAETRGTRLVCVQHGGSFGMARRSPMERHEQQVCDEYWSWGWKEGLAREALPMPSLLAQEPGRCPDGSVLYAGNSVPRYAYRFWSNPLGPQWARVLDWERRWIQRLDPGAFERLLVRPYPIEYGWSQRERLAGEFPRLRLSPPGSRFEEELGHASLFVTSTNHTTLLQALALDKPTILFWEPALNELRPAAAPLFDGLRKAGVLHDSPEDAARAVNAVYRDPEAWWGHPRVRPAVLAFRDRFASVPPDPVEAWSRELLRLSCETSDR